MSIEKPICQDIWALGISPIKLSILGKMLKNYPNNANKQLLINGFEKGFRLEYNGPRLSMISKNLRSADENSHETLSKLNKEVLLGRIAGPFDVKPISTLRTSPIGVIRKNDGGWRLITHLSFPPGHSVNEFIDEEKSSVQYSSFDEIVQMIASLGQGALLGVHDIESAFRLLPVHRADFDLLGIYFNGKFYIDKCLPMGCSISCSLFEKFSSFIHWAVVDYVGKKSLSHYLDDFLFAGRRDTPDCLTLMNAFSEICLALGVPIAKEKSKGPVTKLVFLGLEIDTILMVVRIPDDKLTRLRASLEPLMTKKRVRIKDLESIVGLMAFCSKAIVSSRAFMRRFYDVIAAVKNKKPQYSIRLNHELREDISVWLEFLRNFNGTCYISDNDWVSNDSIQLFTDSSGNAELGCAAYFDGRWIQFKWPLEWGETNTGIMKDITFLELVPIVLALFVWGPEMRNLKILFRIDNKALVDIVNSRTSKSKRVMSLIRPLVLYTMSNNITFKGKHIEGVKNSVADSLSRFQVRRFRQLAPQAAAKPEPLPMQFLGLISKMKLID